MWLLCGAVSLLLRLGPARTCIVLVFLMIRRPPRSTRTDTLFPYTTLFRSEWRARMVDVHRIWRQRLGVDLEQPADNGAPEVDSPPWGFTLRALEAAAARPLWRRVRDALTRDEFDALVVWLNQCDRVKEAHADVLAMRWRRSEEHTSEPQS